MRLFRFVRSFRRGLMSLLWEFGRFTVILNWVKVKGVPFRSLGWFGVSSRMLLMEGRSRLVGYRALRGLLSLRLLPIVTCVYLRD